MNNESKRKTNIAARCDANTAFNYVSEITYEIIFYNAFDVTRDVPYNTTYWATKLITEEIR